MNQRETSKSIRIEINAFLLLCLLLMLIQFKSGQMDSVKQAQISALNLEELCTARWMEIKVIVA